MQISTIFHEKAKENWAGRWKSLKFIFLSDSNAFMFSWIFNDRKIRENLTKTAPSSTWECWEFSKFSSYHSKYFWIKQIFTEQPENFIMKSSLNGNISMSRSGEMFKANGNHGNVIKTASKFPQIPAMGGVKKSASKKIMKRLLQP